MKFEQITETSFNLSKAVGVLKEAHGTIAEDFGFTKENNPSNNAFIDEELLKNQLSKGIELYLLITQNEAIACVAIEKSKREAETFYIEKVSVIPAYRHQGLGVQLIEFATSKIREKNGKWISISLIDSHHVLKKWYESQGFQETGTKDFPHLPFRVCFMKKKLNYFFK